MKMILAAIEDTKIDSITKALLQAAFRVTRLASTGSLLREGTTTLMIGVNDEEVEAALAIIREQFPTTKETKKTRATIFVLNVKDFERG
ncbi:MAG: cyclic-di-AMP receptor [Chloroflexi bacterium]|nr:cyclic-di-AMP receptor [Chloroflexota bacterium]